jgi:two-component system, cell cycle sensor histidine kinase and response regulator CckA
MGNTGSALLSTDSMDANPRSGAAGASAVTAPSRAGTATAPRSALVVDDEALIRWSVSETLAGLGVDVEQAGDGAAALTAIADATVPFDLVVLDLRLPDVGDLSLLRRVRELLPEAAVILMTAFATPDLISDARASGVRAILHKPFALEELSRIVSAGDAPIS